MLKRDEAFQAAQALASAEYAFSEEVLRLVASGETTWNAQHRAEVSVGRDRHIARARYEIAIAELGNLRR